MRSGKRRTGLTIVSVSFALVLIASNHTEASGNSLPDLYFSPGTGSGGIYQLDLDDPSTADAIVPTDLVNTSTGMALDYYGRQLYWIADTQYGDADKIRRTSLDGSGVELFLYPSGQPADLEIDPYRGLLYYTERFTNSINVIGLDGTNQRQLLATVEPRGMDLDLVSNHLYWAEFSSNSIRRADLDGQNVMGIITTGVTRPFDVTVDPIHDRLYWVELGADVHNLSGNVWMANMDGTDVTLIATDLYQPTDLVLDLANGLIYWGAGSRLYQATLDGSQVQEVPAPRIEYRNLVLDVVPIPEPITLSLLTLSGLAILRRQR